MGTNYYVVPNRPSVEEPIHIGKSSMGWLFCFHDYEDKWHEPPIVWHTYEQVINWLQKNTVETSKYIIMNEYDEIVSLKEFVELVEWKQIESVDNPDNFIYCRNVNGYRFMEGVFC